ncbi:histidine triad (HIT) family protein [Nocardioides terrae]|uniref:Histidine triad (HIT) family protein n=1 Tax=Nocardioides terrae TaxID=574651 RepID=A0A1I1D7S3_9ACTN|nr:HIT domain-containing protein [Nocardioides terrae]SFB70376.1 histidine triad (HIT) family protein [Nocardioides terrae]
MATDANCLFCKIVTGEIPGDVVRSDDRLVAFRDIAPKAPLHVLIAPRDHQPNAAASAAADPTIVGELVAAAAGIAQQEGYEAYNLLFNTGAEAGQTIFHTHLHLLAGGITALPV